MGAHIEWLCPLHGIMRIGSGFEVWGDKYEFICGVQREGPKLDVVRFKGGDSISRVDLIRERDNIRALLKPLGIVKVCWTSQRKGAVKEVVKHIHSDSATDEGHEE